MFLFLCLFVLLNFLDAVDGIVDGLPAGDLVNSFLPQIFARRRLRNLVIPLPDELDGFLDSRFLLLLVLLDNLLPTTEVLLYSSTLLNQRIAFIIIGLVLPQ